MSDQQQTTDDHRIEFSAATPGSLHLLRTLLASLETTDDSPHVHVEITASAPIDVPPLSEGDVAVSDASTARTVETSSGATTASETDEAPTTAAVDVDDVTVETETEEPVETEPDDRHDVEVDDDTDDAFTTASISGDGTPRLEPGSDEHKVLATVDDLGSPTTAAEVGAALKGTAWDLSKQRVGPVLGDLYNQGALARRRRSVESEDGRAPFEYVLTGLGETARGWVNQRASGKSIPTIDDISLNPLDGEKRVGDERGESGDATTSDETTAASEGEVTTDDTSETSETADETASESESEFVCPVCGESFGTGAGRGSHKHFKHDIKSEESIHAAIRRQARERDIPVSQTPAAGTSGGDSSTARTTEGAADEEVDCEFCSESFETRSERDAHERHDHADERDDPSARRAALPAPEEVTVETIDDIREQFTGFTLTTGSRPYRVLSTLTLADDPVTSRTIQTVLTDTEWEMPASAISGVLTSLYNNGLVEREQLTDQLGQPFEYELTDFGVAVADAQMRAAANAGEELVTDILDADTEYPEGMAPPDEGPSGLDVLLTDGDGDDTGVGDDDGFALYDDEGGEDAADDES